MYKNIKNIVLVLFICIGLYILFSGFNTYEGYTTQASDYSNLVQNGIGGTTKTVKANANTNANPPGQGAYGSNGIAKNGYDANGYAILAFANDGAPIIGYNGTTPILGKVAPPSTTPPPPQLAPVMNVTGFNGDGTPIFDNQGPSSIPFQASYNSPSSVNSGVLNGQFNNRNNNIGETDSTNVAIPGVIARYDF
jgi:hypothetical protein